MSLLSDFAQLLTQAADNNGGNYPDEYWLSEEEFGELWKEMREYAEDSAVPYYHYEIEKGLVGKGYWATDPEGYCPPNIYFMGVVVRRLG